MYNSILQLAIKLTKKYVKEQNQVRSGTWTLCRILPQRNTRIVILEALKKDDKRKADQFLQELLSDRLIGKTLELSAKNSTIT